MRAASDSIHAEHRIIVIVVPMPGRMLDHMQYTTEPAPARGKCVNRAGTGGSEAAVSRRASGTCL